MTADPLTGNDDEKFELANFPTQLSLRRSWSPLLHFFQAVFFILLTVGIDTPIVKPTQQQLSGELLFWK